MGSIESWAAENDARRAEVYKALLRDARVQNEEIARKAAEDRDALLRELHEAQTATFVAEFRAAEQRNRVRLDMLWNTERDSAAHHRKTAQAVRVLSVIFAALIVAVAVLLYVVTQNGSLPRLLRVSTEVSLLLCGWGLGWCMAELTRRFHE